MMTPDDPEDRIASRLPADPGYWDALADRITTGAAPILEEYRTWDPWWKQLAQFGPSLGAAAVAAAVIVLFVAPMHAGASGSTPQLTHALAPDDPIAREFVGDAPPDISTLLPLAEEATR